MVAVGQAGTARRRANSRAGSSSIPGTIRLPDLVALWDGREFTTAEILDALDVKQARRDRSHEMRVGNVLRELGYARRRARRGEDGHRRYVYCRPTRKEDAAKTRTRKRCDREK